MSIILVLAKAVLLMTFFLVIGVAALTVTGFAEPAAPAACAAAPHNCLFVIF